MIGTRSVVLALTLVTVFATETLAATLVQQDASSLLIAARDGLLDRVEELLDGGVDPNARGQSGQTALMLAAGGGHSKVVKLLLDRGADPGARDDDEDTALGAYAAAQGHTEVVELLIQGGASALMTNKDGMTPLMFAALYGHTDTMRALESTMLPLAAAQQLSELAAVLESMGREVDANRIERRATAIRESVTGDQPQRENEDPPLFVLAGPQGRCWDLGYPRLTQCVSMDNCRYTHAGRVRVIATSGEARDEKDLVERFVRDVRRLGADAVVDLQVQPNRYNAWMGVLEADAISFTDEACKRLARSG